MSVSIHPAEKGSSQLQPGLRPWLRTAVCLLALGATLGAGLDGIHTHMGVTAYAVPWFWLMAVWVPPLFAFAAFTIGMIPPLADLAAYGRVTPVSLGKTILGLLLFVASYFLSGLLAHQFAVCTWVLAALFAFIWWLGDGKPLGLGLAVIAAVSGTTVEATLSHLGTFYYVSPHVAGVPVWLPWLYASAAIAVGNVGRYVLLRR